ncbi:hypothetical protein AVEN_114499-1 [Araneus ventricosus]|uniref:Uncharacterized protein n=1 Tax=Araneus ventricosus TaxID=182803 RepID=A0A4Y2S4Y9_ARAVE|nr:hypothetical protein AVEN_68393-1 [Araneus ventricosus]GBN82666.1 hypothetical protein AVEN_114499-1 [Araneus ventricosus]
MTRTMPELAPPSYWRFFAQALEALASCLANPGGLKIHSTYTVVQTDGELATFGRGRESQNLLDVNCSAMPTAKLRHWIKEGPQNLFYAHRRQGWRQRGDREGCAARRGKFCTGYSTVVDK